MTAAPELLQALAGSDLPPLARACVAAISEGEVPTVAGQSVFRILYSGGTLVSSHPDVVTIGRWRYWMGGLTVFPGWQGARLDNGLISTAAGACQDTHTTFRDNQGFGITSFDPRSQLSFNWHLAQHRFAMKTTPLPMTLIDVLVAGGPALSLIPTYLGSTWPGGCDGAFPKRFKANLLALGKTSHVRRVS